MTLGVMNNLSSMFAKEGDEKVDMNQVIQQQRADIEKKIKETFDLKMVDNYTYSFDKSNQWISSMSGKNTIKGKSENNNIDVTIEIKMTKK